MGLQTATITKIGSLTVHTTFVTGMVNKFCQLVSHILFDTYDLACHRGTPTVGHYAQSLRTTMRNAAFIFSIWLCYLVGAISGTRLTQEWKVRALYVPVAMLFVVIAADQILPLAVEEEKDQSER